MILSIIIPVWNVEAYIADTLESCLDQDVEKNTYEIICIDDGSSDSSAAIIEEYARDHTNIRLIKKENQGVSATRNCGITKAQGKYIWFVDSDDLVRNNCLKWLISIVETEAVDYLKFAMRSFTEHPPVVPALENYDVCDDPNRIYEFLFAKGGGGVCSGIFSRALIQDNHIRFVEDIKYSEDVLFGYEVMIASKRVAKTPVCCYFYRQRAGSAMHSDNLESHARSMLLLAEAYDTISKTYSDSWRMISLNKRDFAVKANLFSLMQLGDMSKAECYLQKLKQKGFYPYPFKKELLVGNETFKQWIINGISFFFPVEWYFKLCVRLGGLLKGKKE